MAECPVFVSPDGNHEQHAPTATDQVRLRYLGWTEKPAPAGAQTDAPADEKPKPRPRAKSTKK